MKDAMHFDMAGVGQMLGQWQGDKVGLLPATSHTTCPDAEYID